jgi:hypothetical protein
MIRDLEEMMKRLQLWKEEPVESGGSVTTGVIIEDGDGSRRKLWYRVPAGLADCLSDSCNPFVTGTVFTAMRESKDLVVHGDVSRKLLENLEEFQTVWASWYPEKYSKVEIIPDSESGDYLGEKPDSTLAAFSGGADGAFTVYRHNKGLCGRLTKNVKTGIFIHGFNIALDRKDIYERAADKAEIMLNSLGIELIRVATNFRDLGDNFGDAHAAEIASCMLLFENSYSVGLIASSRSYANMRFPYGSNLITDRLLSSDRFEIIHDGAGYSRSEKVEVISSWKEALKYLRVCWQIDKLDENCCVCEKCIRTILNFRALGLDRPECFEHDATDKMISNIKGLKLAEIGRYEEILSKAREHSVSGSWISALEKSMKKNRRAQVGWRKKAHQLRNRFGIRTRLRKRISKK